MAKTEGYAKTERVQKGNSLDTLLAIYILRILKCYSSPQKWISANQVYDYLKNEYFIMRNENAEAQIKKIRRYLETLHESYGKGCIAKKEGKTRKEGNKWYYDASQDPYAGEDGATYETLSREEIEFIVDIIASSKILNSAGTHSIIEKLLKKTDLSQKERRRRLENIREEEWNKSISEKIVSLRDTIESCMEACQSIRFDYEDEKAISATPCDWDSKNGKYILIAKVAGAREGEFGSFELDKIKNFQKGDIDWDFCDDTYFDMQYQKPDEMSLENLFENIRIIQAAIEKKNRIEFKYFSYVIQNERVIYDSLCKCILPHSLVFTDGKYYLIGFDENAKEKDKKVDYYRVDLMSDLSTLKNNRKLSSLDEIEYDAIQRARAIERHPLMQAGKDVPVTFKVVESALDRVSDAFGVKPDRMRVTDETRAILKKTARQHTAADHSNADAVEERVVKVQVRTTVDEAFRWALANADAVEVDSQEIRDMIARVADPVYQLYTQTLPDKVRENIDYVLREGTFKISSMVDENTAFATYKELSKRELLGVVDNIGIAGEKICDVGDYIGDFINAERLYISAPQLKNLSWASRLVNIKTLDLTQAQIDDASWMKEMKDLRRVYLAESSIADLSVLSEHKDIDYLDISDTDVSDINFIEKYSKLTYLNIVGCPIEDYSPLFTTQSRLKCLEIDEDSIQAIGEETVRNRHIGINIISRKSNPFWRMFI